MERAAGRLEVIAGPMFAGKTEELLRRVRRALVGGRRVQLFAHALDTRGGPGRVVSHAGLEHPSLPVASPAELASRADPEADLVAVDEAHFFGPDLVEVALGLARRTVLVVAGLDVTFEGRPFEPLPSLMALAERVDKLTAICTLCGEEAVYHVRVAPSQAGATDLVPEHVGGGEKYQARCRRHFP
ncbi:MAG TPA: thymidine kinase [Actinomycetota bacterium]|nr:thymidine kinase [Actinomycetota bacterium]